MAPLIELLGTNSVSVLQGTIVNMDENHNNSARSRRGRIPTAERERRQREVLDAALAVIAEQGYEAATMTVIAQRAGASKETLYAWFGSRAGLVTALIEANADASTAHLSDIFEGGSASDLATATATLVEYATGLLTLLTSDSSVALNRAAMTSRSLAAVLLDSGRHRIGPIVERYLGVLHDAGLIAAPDPAEAYRALYGLVVRDTQIRTLLGERPPNQHEIAEHAKHAVASFFILTR